MELRIAVLLYSYIFSPDIALLSVISMGVVDVDGPPDASGCC